MDIAQKKETLEKLNPVLEGNYIYVVDCDGLSANQMYALRFMLNKEDIACCVVPNAIMRRICENKAYEALTEVLKQSSMLVFAKEQPAAAARIIKDFKKKEKAEKPVLKGAWACEELFVGAENLDTLSKLKTKEELLGELITMLENPAQQLISALESGNSAVSNLLKKLEN
jgi:large subunit ribosomal protein L10